jgi:multiple sugar transport system substrate-binding protein
MIGRLAQSRVLARGLMGLVLLSVAGCSSSSATNTPAAPASTGTPVPTPAVTAPPNAEKITFWSWVPGTQDQVDAFNASHTDVFVNYVNNGNGTAEYTKLKTALQAQSSIPDVVQIEYQYLPTFISRGSLADLAKYGANDVKSKFVPWTWAQVSQGSGVFAYPQDAGPMLNFCNKAMLTKYGITAPTTWDELAADAAKLHKADKNAYLTNFTSDAGWYFGLLWQSGARPFVVDGSNITINFTSPEVTRVAKYWGELIKSGNLSPVTTYTNDWNTAMDKQTVACWPSGAWGGEYIASIAPTVKGNWEVTPIPQWTAGGAVNGNYGGSSIAVTSASQHQKAADEFARWLTTDPKATLSFANGAGNLYPVLGTTAADPAWINFTDPVFGGQETHKVMAAAGAQVDPSFGWSPFTDYVYQTYGDEVNKVIAGSITFEAAMADLQAKSTQFAKDQGFTVK